MTSHLPICLVVIDKELFESIPLASFALYNMQMIKFLDLAVIDAMDNYFSSKFQASLNKGKVTLVMK